MFVDTAKVKLQAGKVEMVQYLSVMKSISRKGAQMVAMVVKVAT